MIASSTYPSLPKEMAPLIFSWGLGHQQPEFALRGSPELHVACSARSLPYPMSAEVTVLLLGVSFGGAVFLSVHPWSRRQDQPVVGKHVRTPRELTTSERKQEQQRCVPPGAG